MVPNLYAAKIEKFNWLSIPRVAPVAIEKIDHFVVGCALYFRMEVGQKLLISEHFRENFIF